ncbi:GNAT family N-acetyltransferase [Sphingomonas sp. CFBP 13720]|uniref:GNAT family N-acetyltransferase n=1 Tax=Sphingomonas sp. CFBP 13720 TaxID=2775302 RepID=UPI0017875967|nr:GNAT family N-acetyltransferase [Sphingomonas sp. CFBP 13720]MBD8677642.1 GNAT family N-acetyltransferase [Sphingomonas sp. CFBP 13720]
MEPPLIRPATIADVPSLHALVESAYRGDSARGGWTHEADLLGGQRTDAELLSAVLSDPACRILIAGDGAGCVQVTRVDGGRCALGLLAVRPDGQALGLGRRLIAAAERVARDDYASKTMEMTVIRRRAELIAWYERRGYRRTGEERAFPLDDRRFGVPKTLDLDFIVLERALTGQGSPEIESVKP